MKTMMIVAGAAALMLAAGSADAAAKHRASGAVAAPKQPIPYSQLDAYLKASPKQRASKDWWSEANASTGMSANTAATTPAMPRDATPGEAVNAPGAPNTSGAAPNTMSPPDASATTPPAPETTTTPDQGKGEMSNPAVDKPH